jgi:serpin B
MKRKAIAAAVLIAMTTGVLMAEKAAPAKPDDARAIATAGNSFAWRLYSLLVEEEGNLLFSPSGIHAALAMTLAGARGDTYIAMREPVGVPCKVIDTGLEVRGNYGAMRTIYEYSHWPQKRVHKAYRALLAKLKPGKKAGYQLHVANTLWGQKGYPWLDEFLKTTHDNYGAGLREVDFARKTEAARQTINKWVEDQTRKKIKELFAKGILDGRTRLVLTNAICFKGHWASRFEKKGTKDEPFKFAATKSVQVSMMHQTGKFGYFEAKDLQVLRLPYAGKEASMVIFLPKPLDGLSQIDAWLKPIWSLELAVKARVNLPVAEQFFACIESPKLTSREVMVSIPRFRMASGFHLHKKLRSMGMSKAFTPGAADFSSMNGKKDLFISAVVHRAFMDVSEEGAEAATATAVVTKGGKVTGTGSWLIDRTPTALCLMFMV